MFLLNVQDSVESLVLLIALWCYVVKNGFLPFVNLNI